MKCDRNALEWCAEQLGISHTNVDNIQLFARVERHRYLNSRKNAEVRDKFYEIWSADDFYFDWEDCSFYVTKYDDDDIDDGTMHTFEVFIFPTVVDCWDQGVNFEDMPDWLGHLCESTYSVDDDKSDDDIIKALTALGATFAGYDAEE